MTEGATNEVLHLSNDQINDVLQQFANGFGQVRRSPVMRLPSEQGLDYANVTFPSRDGVPLEGWFLPAARSAQLTIANHPSGVTRSRLLTHVQPARSQWA